LLTALESLPALIGNKKAIRGQACTRPRFPLSKAATAKCGLPRPPFADARWQTRR